jgi:hypothetical protein
VSLLREWLPALKVRVVNVVDLMTLQPAERASAWAAGRGIRFDLHGRQADPVRVSRLSVVDPSA